jgi:hypothetical protein
VKIATLLLDAGCNVNALDDDCMTALLHAAQCSSAEMVEFLVVRGADTEARSAGSWTALHYACINGAFGREIIPVLCAAGADVSVKNGKGTTAFQVAISKSKATVDALSPFLPPSFKLGPWRPSVDYPVGSWICVTGEWGGKLLPIEFASDILSTDWRWEQCWALLRGSSGLLLDNSDVDAFRTLVQCPDTELWKWAWSEPQMQQHPITGDTMFHLLCRTEALDVTAKWRW